MCLSYGRGDRQWSAEKHGKFSYWHANSLSICEWSIYFYFPFPVVNKNVLCTAILALLYDLEYCSTLYLVATVSDVSDGFNFWRNLLKIFA